MQWLTFRIKIDAAIIIMYNNSSTSEHFWNCVRDCERQVSVQFTVTHPATLLSVERVPLLYIYKYFWNCVRDCERQLKLTTLSPILQPNKAMVNFLLSPERTINSNRIAVTDSVATESMVPTAQNSKQSGMACAHTYTFIFASFFPALRLTLSLELAKILGKKVVGIVEYSSLQWQHRIRVQLEHNTQGDKGEIF